MAQGQPVQLNGILAESRPHGVARRRASAPARQAHPRAGLRFDVEVVSSVLVPLRAMSFRCVATSCAALGLHVPYVVWLRASAEMFRVAARRVVAAVHDDSGEKSIRYEEHRAMRPDRRSGAVSARTHVENAIAMLVSGTVPFPAVVRASLGNAFPHSLLNWASRLRGNVYGRCVAVSSPSRVMLSAPAARARWEGASTNATCFHDSHYTPLCGMKVA